MKNFQKSIGIALLLAALGGQALAQYGGMGGGGMGGGGGGRRGHGADTTGTSRTGEAPPGPQARASQVNDKLYDLRTRMQLTPEQGKLWDSMSDQIWDMTVHAGPARAPAEDDAQSALLAVQRRAADAQDRATRLQKLGDTIGKLYSALTPEQQRISDQSLPALIP
ncbi:MULTISPECIES: Spy/CpxP family protein refolding chaperone [unclassified Variovorax]|uniref:Spy/CpxP family protein refolding chaperone n=1 Tax=unclassified Variovorax TaxID=663243 RepID=UPI001BD62484|nr:MULTISPECIES: Spy/CpxP family protein refolding chaperone [unclassified Variovorax]